MQFLPQCKKQLAVKKTLCFQVQMRQKSSLSNGSKSLKIYQTLNDCTEVYNTHVCNVNVKYHSDSYFR